LKSTLEKDVEDWWNQKENDETIRNKNETKEKQDTPT
jgi:hypothetical protein